MKIGILVPLLQELTSLTATSITPGRCDHLSDNLIICLTGIGRSKTRQGFEQLMLHHPDLLLSWGSAAGLDPHLKAGDLVIPESVKVDHNVFNTSSWFNQKMLSLLPGSVRISQGMITETRRVLASPSEKQQLFESTGCMTADMESGALAELASAQNLPFGVVRSVSDAAQTSLPGSLLASFQNGIFNPRLFIWQALLKPTDWSSIIKLSGNFKKVKKTLIIAGDIVKQYSHAWM